MTKQTQTAADSSTEVVLFRDPEYTDEKLKQIRDWCSKLTVANAEDAQGYQKVIETRGKLKKLTAKVEKKRLELNREYKKRVDDEADRIKGQISLIDGPLLQHESQYDRWQEDLRAEEERQLLAKIKERQDMLTAIGSGLNHNNLRTMSDDDFSKYYEAENARLNREKALDAKEQELAAKEAELKAMMERMGIQPSVATQLAQTTEATSDDIDTQWQQDIATLRTYAQRIRSAKMPEVKSQKFLAVAAQIPAALNMAACHIEELVNKA